MSIVVKKVIWKGILMKTYISDKCFRVLQKLGRKILIALIDKKNWQCVYFPKFERKCYKTGNQVYLIVLLVYTLL